MTASRPARILLAATILFSTAMSLAQQPATPKHLFFHVSLSSQFNKPVSGRLLLFVTQGENAKEVDVNQMSPASVYIAAKEVRYWAPGTIVDIDADGLVSPGPLSAAAPGNYQAQAILDVDHSYNYLGRQPGDLASPVASLTSWNPAHDDTPTITIDTTIASPPQATEAPEFKAAIQSVNFTSPSLSAFWGRQIQMKAWVLLPPGYRSHPGQRYPTVYFTHGFGGNSTRIRGHYAPMLFDRMLKGKMPEMIWVLLDESTPTGTHEFADSVNNGPWGRALTTELIPHLESRYRMDARTSGRFLQGHSSGGWATLWLQVTYPKIFGGTWSTSPDPSDFHNFSTVDLYTPHANLFHNADGTPVPIVRDHGKVLVTMEQLARLEVVLGDYGGQLQSFDWVFSPRGQGGRPMEMFNRESGDIDPNVVAYWREHYDIAHRVQTNWSRLAPDLRGKIHLYVGTADTFYLDGAAHLLQQVLEGLNAGAHFTFLPDRTHFDLYVVGDDKSALFDQIAAEMYAVARPNPLKSAGGRSGASK
jgi:enterochelin esterase-like enzyme